MKKITIIVAIIVSSGLTAYCLNAKQTTPSTTITLLKVNKADFAVKSLNTPKSDIATAD
jgi:hypothetical protein